MINLLKIKREDLLSSLSLGLISLPISAGIAVASKASPESGMISAIFGSLVIGLFTSSPLVIYGPAAGLSIFIAAAAAKFGGFDHVAPAIILSGIWITLLSFLKAHRLVNMIPTLVMKGMAAGIGFMVILNTIPYLVGYSGNSLLHNGFFSFTEISYSLNNMLPGAILISSVSLCLSFVKFNKNFPKAIPIVILGVLINEGMKIFKPDWALAGDNVLTIDSRNLSLHLPHFPWSRWRELLSTSLIITAVIFLEGLVTLDIFHKLDPRHKTIKYRKELLIMGIGNIFMGLMSALPLMPVIIRSKANLQFGARHRSAVLLNGLWLLVAFYMGNILSKIPMASVAVVLVLIGINLLDLPHILKLIRRRVVSSLPYFVTLIMILVTNLLWGILAGFFVGIILAIQSLVHRSIVLVHDEKNYLLKFYKDVNFFNKNELRENLERIPEDKNIVIDGTGNISIDEEIEDFLIEFAEEHSHEPGRVTFVKSRLAISKLFKEI